MRPIDAIELQRRMCALCNQDYSDEPCEPSDCVFIRAINEMPTLTPPNEPLTWNEFAEMEGQPVYIVETGAWRYWALVTHVGKDTVEFVTADDSDDYGSKELYGDKELYGESWVAYRCPPEGEGETR